MLQSTAKIASNSITVPAKLAKIILEGPASPSGRRRRKQAQTEQRADGEAESESCQLLTRLHDCERSSPRRKVQQSSASRVRDHPSRRAR
jgi:hypothetical protein